MCLLDSSSSPWTWTPSWTLALPCHNDLGKKSLISGLALVETLSPFQPCSLAGCCGIGPWTGRIYHGCPWCTAVKGWRPSQYPHIDVPSVSTWDGNLHSQPKKMEVYVPRPGNSVSFSVQMFWGSFSPLTSSVNFFNYYTLTLIWA